MKNTVQQFLLLLGLTLSLSILTLGYAIDLHAQWIKLSQARDHTHQLEASLKDIQQKILKTAQYQTLLSNTQIDFHHLKTTLSQTNKLHRFLNHTHQLGENQGLKFLTIHPQPPVEKDFYRRVPIQLTLLGNYQQFLNFLKLLMTAHQSIDIVEFTLSRQFPADTVVLNNENTPDMLIMHAQAIFYDFS